MAKEDPENIFDQASKMFRKKKRLKKKKREEKRSLPERTKSSEPSSKPVSKTFPDEESLGDKDLDNLYQTAHEQHSNLSDQIDSTYEKIGKTRDEGRSFLSNPDNFDEEQHSLITRIRKRLEGDLLPGEAALYREKIMKQIEKGPIKKKKKRGRRFGGRQGWIRMD